MTHSRTPLKMSAGDIETALSTWVNQDDANLARDYLSDCIPCIAELEGTSYGSWLTRTGFPIEFGFSSKDHRLRYITEVDMPTQPVSQRLDRAIDLAQSFTGVSITGQDIRRLKNLQRLNPASLKYGAWLGVRHQGGRVDVKIYVELPSAFKWSQDTAAESIFHEYAKGRKAAILGFDVRSGCQEFYCWATDMGAAGLADMFRRLDWPAPGYVKTILALFSTAFGVTLHNRLPGRDVGLSLALDDQHRANTVSVYNYSDAVFGGDDKIYKGIMNLCKKHDLTLPGYTNIAHRLKDHQSGYHTYHGMFGFAVSPTDAPHLHIGVTPPPVHFHQLPMHNNLMKGNLS